MAKQKSKSIRVRILNPVPGGQASTSLAHARRYVRQGRARVINPQHDIEFIEADHRHQAAVVSITIGGYNQRPKTSPTPLPVCANLSDYNGMESMRTFARYPDDAENAFRDRDSRVAA
jgi:hypothetical protein